MSLMQFLRIFWARRWLIAATTAACLAGAMMVVLILPPRWEAHSRVMLDLLKPDPVTGLVITGAAIQAYVSTQTDLITDYTVAGRVVDQSGWLSDPVLIRQYDRRSKKDTRDFRRWLAQRVIDNTKVKVLEGSNILEISYTATTPDAARAIADALRRAYMDASLDFRRDDATRNATWFSNQADQLKTQLDAAQSAETAFERANGIVMQDDTTDVDTARLRSLAAQAAAGPAMVSAPMSSPASIQLAQIDAQIAQAAQTLGPNHPELQALRAQRASVAALVAQDQAAARSAAAAAASGGAGALAAAMATQKSRVIAQRDKLGQLNHLQSAINVLRDQYNKTAARAADLRQQAAVVDTGLTVLGSAVTPKSASFPNFLLIIPGCLGLGLAMGILVALLAELFGRRVRGAEDLMTAIDAPLITIIGPPAKARSERFPKRPRPALPRWPSGKEARA